MPDKSRIDDEKPFQRFNYRSADLGPKSALHVVAICAECGEPRVTSKRCADRLCRKCASIGKPSPMAGKRHTEETRQKMRDNHPDVSGENGTFFGRTHTEEAKMIMSESHKGKIPWNLGVPMSVVQRQKLLNRPPPSIETRKKMSDARLGKSIPPETCAKMSASRMGDKNPNFGKPLSQSVRDKLSEIRTGTHPSIESRRKHSATLQGIPYDEWESFAKDQPYCPKFNEACSESNREKYDRRCFLSDVTEADNGQKLSVHHYDMNNAQGCDGHAWKLVPLCRKLHNYSHTPTWMARIQYLLNHVWSGA